MEECACCSYSVLPTAHNRRPRGHVVCAECRQRLGREDCLFCNPCLQPLELQAEPQEEVPPAPGPCGTRMLRGLRVVLGAGAAFVSLVYAGKVYIWFIAAVVVDKECTWCHWDSFRYCTIEFMAGLLGTALLCAGRE